MAGEKKHARGRGRGRLSISHPLQPMAAQREERPGGKRRARRRQRQRRTQPARWRSLAPCATTEAAQQIKDTANETVCLEPKWSQAKKLWNEHINFFSPKSPLYKEWFPCCILSFISIHSFSLSISIFCFSFCCFNCSIKAFSFILCSAFSICKS